MAVIGDGKENIILDARIVLPKPLDRGRPPMKRTDWFIERIENLKARLRSKGLSLAGCIALVDTAYGTQRVNAALARMHVPLVSQMHSSRVLSDVLNGQLMVSCSTGLFLTLWYWLQEDLLSTMSGEPGVEYLRGCFHSKSLGNIVVLARKSGRERKFYFSTDQSIKAIAIHRAAVRRWRMESVFWSLKLELGWKEIRNHFE